MVEGISTGSSVLLQSGDKQGADKQREIGRVSAGEASTSHDQPTYLVEREPTQISRLANIAQSLLNVPATSSPSERVFSAVGLIVTKLHSSLEPSNVDALFTR